MRGGASAGKVAEAAVVAGIGAAVCMGWGAAVAQADEGRGSSISDTSASSDPDPGKPAERSDDAAAQDAEDADEDAPSGDDQQDADLDEDGDEDEGLDTDDEVDDGDSDVDDEGDTGRSAPDETSHETEEAEGTVRLDEPVVTDVDTPDEDTDPAPVPETTAQLLTTTAGSRRDNDPGAATTPTHESIEPAATSLAIDTLDAPAPNGVTYTAKPNFFDQITVISLRILRSFSSFVGVDFYGLIGKALERDKPPWWVKSGLDVRRNEFEVSDGTTWDVWEFHPPNPTGKTVVAVHGGGFIVEPLLTHWLDYSNMARSTGATVIVPMYPLATTEAGTATKLVPAMAQFISDRIASDGAENVSIYADSAGPQLALSAVRQLIVEGKEVPASMVLLSFAPDNSISNPDAFEIDDPIIDIRNLDFYTDVNHYGDGLDPRDPMISSLFFEDEVYAALPPTTIYVGSLEWVLPDTLLLQEKWSNAGGVVSTVVGQGQYHDWALGVAVNSQKAKVRPDIYRQLGLNEVASGPRTIVTQPASFWDRLILRTLQNLRRNNQAIFESDGEELTGTAPPVFVKPGLSITETEYNGWTVWELAPKKDPSGEYVVALHGGGFLAEANIINWADYAAMARDTGATVVVPIYPLAPPKGTGTVPTLIPPMADYVSRLIDQHGVDNVSMYGDSAGATFAMLTVQELMRRCRSDVQCALPEAQPSRMVLISPILHLTLTGPAVDDIDDPIIPRPNPNGGGPDVTGGGLGANDPRVNPIMGDDLTGLPPTTVYVGTVERPYVGNLMFRDKLLAQDPDADFTVVIGDGQMHDWALGGIFVNSQAALWRSTIYRQLGLLPEEL